MNGWKNEYSYVNALNLIWGRHGLAQQPIATPLSDPHPYPFTFQSALNLKETQVSFSKHLFNLNNYILLGVGRWQKMTGRNSLSSCIKNSLSLSRGDYRLQAWALPHQCSWAPCLYTTPPWQDHSTCAHCTDEESETQSWVA